MKANNKQRSLVLAVGLALALAGCGGSSQSETSSGAAVSGASAAAVTQAQAAVDALAARPTGFTVPPLTSKPAPGKTLAFMSCGAPVCKAFEPIVKSAADAVGWKFRAINIGLTPDTVTAGYNEAVRIHPDGVIASGSFSTSTYSHQLEQFKAMNVPVVVTNVPDAGEATGVVLTAADAAQRGTDMGDWIMADSKGHDAHVAIVTTPATPIYGVAHDSLKKAMAACVSCSFDEISYPFTDLGTVLPTKVVTFMSSHRDVNYMFFDFASAVDGVPAALQAAGLSGKVKLLATNIGATELGYMKNGQLDATALVPYQEGLWTAFNVVLRATENLPVEPGFSIKMPRMIMTKNNIIDSGPSSPILVSDYQAIFKKAWQVG